MMKKFHLEREIDISGISGCGKVAEGVIFTDTNECVIHWLGEHSCINIYHSIDDAIYVHGHSGATKIIFDDPEN